jgi:hypothetical protein
MGRVLAGASGAGTFTLTGSNTPFVGGTSAITVTVP